MKNNPSIISFLRRNISALALSAFLLVTTLGLGQKSSKSLTTIPCNVKAVIAQPDNLSCINPTVILDGSSSTSGNNIIYEWTKNGTIVSGATTRIAVATSGGTYTLTVSDVITGCSNSASVIVGIDSPPQARIATFEKLTCPSNSVTLDGSASTSGPSITYQWIATNGGLIVSGATTNKAIVSRAGTYTLEVTDVIKYCISTTTVSVTSDCNLSSPEFEFTSEFNLYPNPTADVLNIQLKSDAVINSVAVYNFMGQLVLNTTETTTAIHVSGLPKGTYILKIISNNGTTATKFVKE